MARLSVSRRSFLQASVAGCAALAGAQTAIARPGDVVEVDLHAHLDNSTIDAVTALGRERGVTFGIVEHAGTKANKYPVVLSNDDELRAYLKMLDGKGVYKGVQAEWTDWMGCFSRAALLGLDYAITDTMTFPGKDGQRVKLWEAGVEERVDLSRPEAFMDRYVDWHIQIVSGEPIDVLVNVSWLPAALAGSYDALWTDARIERVVAAMKQYEVACEISSSYELPKGRFLRAARAAGLKFAFGSNGRYPKMGLLEYSRAMARELELTAQDVFVPGQRPSAIARRL